jgi:hypothetical protein
MQQMAREQKLEVMKPELNARPRVYYRNLWRYAKCFIGGTISANSGECVDCVEGAKVRLMKDNLAVAETVSDNFGDFKFDRLDENSGRYVVEVAARDGTKKAIEITLGASVNIGEIRL